MLQTKTDDHKSEAFDKKYETGAKHTGKPSSLEYQQGDKDLTQDMSISKDSTENIPPLNLQLHCSSSMGNETNIHSSLDEEYARFSTQKSRVLFFIC